MADVDQQIVREIRMFDFVAQRIWPHVRGLFKNSIAPRCTQCVISSRVPYVTLNEKGVCNLCIDFNNSIDAEEEAWRQKYVAHMEKELDELLNKIDRKLVGSSEADIRRDLGLLIEPSAYVSLTAAD